MKALPLIVLLAFAVSACGPIRSTVGIIEAEQTLKAAREAGAAELAPYPFALAERLLAKAIEEQGYADYYASWKLAVEAKGLAEEAQAAAAVAPPLPAPEPSPLGPAPIPEAPAAEPEAEPADAPEPAEEAAPGGETEPADEPSPEEQPAPAEEVVEPAPPEDAP